MNCEQTERDLLLDQSGELGWWRARALRRHLAACPACQAYRRSLTELAATVAPHLEEEPNPFLVRRVIRVVGEQPAPTPAWQPSYARVAACAAVVLLLATVAIPLLWSHGNRHREGVRQAARMSETGSILALALEREDSDLESLHEGERRALARELLELEGFAVEDFDAEENVTEAVEHPPTALQWRSIPAVPAGRCG
jgi:anti-sigma factor RsiW